MTAPVTHGDTAARLLAEADSFLRLGLLDKATEHLAGAVRGDPSLRGLREPLVKLYVSQGQYKSAIAELWALLTPCEDPQEEIRYLRYILRLGEKSPAAEQRLKAILSQHDVEATTSSEDTEVPKRSVREAKGQLRAYLDDHRPPTDFAQTLHISDAETQHLPDGVTRADLAEMAAMADAMAFSSSPLKEQLEEIDGCLREQRYDEARRLLQVLSASCPYSKTVKARLDVLDQVASGKQAEGPVGRRTLEITLGDIEEESALPPAAPPARRGPPPLPPAGSEPGGEPMTEAARAIAAGAALRSTGQLEQAAATFLDGINRPEASESNLSELFYELGATYEQLSNTGDAILYYHLSIGAGGSFRDAEHRISTLKKDRHTI